MILLSDDSVLLIGGRGSPCRPNPHQYILKPVLDRKWVCSKVGTNEGVLGSYPGSCLHGHCYLLVLARWRHSATLMKNGRVVIVGGCSEGGMVLDDIQLLDYTKSTVNKVGILNINNDSVMVIPY